MDISGHTYGRWTVLTVSFRKNKHEHWLCRCSCGTERYVTTNSLRRGNSKSCGCYNLEVARSRAIHGATRNNRFTPEYQSWQDMKKRCGNPNNRYYHNYGGRGIKVCERWTLSFTHFLQDMGLRPSPKHTVERKDNDGNYEPSNCTWETRLRQNNNRRDNFMVTHSGITMTGRDWERQLGLPKDIVRQRIKCLGWTTERALTQPTARPKK